MWTSTFDQRPMHNHRVLTLELALEVYKYQKRILKLERNRSTKEEEVDSEIKDSDQVEDTAEDIIKVTEVVTAVVTVVEDTIIIIMDIMEGEDSAVK